MILTTEVSHSTQLSSLLNNTNFNAEVDFPLRYFDLTRVCDIGQARLGEKCTVIATLSEIEDGQLLATDETGSILLKSYTHGFYGTFNVGQKIIISGVIDTFDHQKCVNNPLLKNYVEGKYTEVMPVYEKDFSVDRNDIRDETLLAIHGFSSKVNLVCARRNLKLQQLEKCKKACLELGTTIQEELLKPYSCNNSYSEKVRLITRFEEGEETQAIKEEKNCVVVCPLAYMTADERNAKVYGFDRLSKVPESNPHPNISIEVDKDCASNSKGVRQRGTILTALLHKPVETSSSCSEDADLIVVEDADRISTVEIDFWMRRSQSNFLLVSNSKSALQLSRLKFLCESHTQSEVLWHELSYRREGDILGCRNPVFRGLSLVKGTDLGFVC